MKVNKNFTIDGLIEFIPNIYGDSRGQFIETYNKDILKELGFNEDFKQDNQSISKGGVFRGIHLQLDPFAQGKLVRVAKGRAIDYAVCYINSRKRKSVLGSTWFWTCFHGTRR